MSSQRGQLEWFEDDAFWAAMEPFLFTDERMEAGEEEIDQVLRHTGVNSGSVLDLCCGPGRHAVALAKRGLQVTAVDKSPHLLARARQRAQDEGVEIEFVQADMREYARVEAFDLAISLFTSFGYFTTPEEDLGVLRSIHRNLKPQGSLVMEMASKEWCAKVYLPTTSTAGPDGSLLVERHEILDGWARIRNEWIVIRDGRAQSFKFEHNLYSGVELSSMLREAGFADVRIFGGLDGKEYGVDVERLVAVAKKSD